MIRPSLIFLGFITGIGLGLLYGWVVSPVKYTDTEPASLRVDYKEGYLSLVAAAYRAEGDLDRAQLRLSKLKNADPISAMTALAQRLAAEGRSEAGDLALLAADLHDAGLAGVTATPIESPVPVLPTATPPPAATTAAPTFAAPTPTFSPQPEFDYALLTREPYCNGDERKPLIIVDVVDANNAPLAGVRITIRWADGEDGFVTGLKPEISASYGDYRMTVGTAYSVQVGARTPAVTGLTAPICTGEQSSEQYPGAIRLVFQRK